MVQPSHLTLGGHSTIPYNYCTEEGDKGTRSVIEYAALAPYDYSALPVPVAMLPGDECAVSVM